MVLPCQQPIGTAIVAIAFASVACGPEPQPAPASSQSTLSQALSRVSGTYIGRQDRGGYDYSNKLELERILSERDRDEAVRLLVDCLDDQSPTQSTIDGASVPLGILCHEALTQLVYYEPLTPSGDVAASWPGYVTPRATPEQMRSAKEAWQKVVSAKRYIFL